MSTPSLPFLVLQVKLLFPSHTGLFTLLSNHILQAWSLLPIANFLVIIGRHRHQRLASVSVSSSLFCCCLTILLIILFLSLLYMLITLQLTLAPTFELDHNHSCTLCTCCFVCLCFVWLWHSFATMILESLRTDASTSTLITCPMRLECFWNTLASTFVDTMFWQWRSLRLYFNRSHPGGLTRPANALTGKPVENFIIVNIIILASGIGRELLRSFVFFITS